MPGALVVRTIMASSEWTRLSPAEESLVAETTLLAPASNAAPVLVRFDGLPEAGVAWPAGVRADIGVQGLSRIEISGADGDSIGVLGRVGR